MSLPRGLEVEPFHPPLLVVALAELFEGFGQFFQGLEMPHPEKLLLESAEETFDAAVAFGLTDEGRGGLQAEKADLALKVVAHEL